MTQTKRVLVGRPKLTKMGLIPDYQVRESDFVKRVQQERIVYMAGVTALSFVG